MLWNNSKLVFVYSLLVTNSFLVFVIAEQQNLSNKSLTKPIPRVSKDAHVDVLEYLSRRTPNCNKVYNGDPECNVTKVVSERTMQWIGKPRSESEDDKDENLKSGGVESRDLMWAENEIEADHFGIPFQAEGSTTMIWGMRQGHGALMALITFLFTPIHFFMTRYMKESFMSRRILYSTVWYQAHVQGVVITAVLLIASLTTAICARGFLGVSLTSAGVVHRYLGWLTTVLFVLLTFLGGFRGYSSPLREATIFLHWLFGSLFYWLMIALMLNAVFIPGSGISSWDSSLPRVYKRDANAAWSGSFIHVIIWIVFEVVMHAIMTYNMRISDRQMAITSKRLYLPVPIPAISEFSSHNAEGHGLRLISFIVYVHCCLLSTLIYYIVSIYNTPWEGKGLGPMSCSHNPRTWKVLENVSKVDHFPSCAW